VSGTAGTTLESIIGVYTATGGAGGKYTYIGPYGNASTLTFRIDDGVASHTEIGSATYTVGEWHHAAITYNSTTGTATAYFNGDSVGSISYTTGIVFDSVPFNVARSENNTHTDCYVASIKAYNRDLSDTEMKQNFEALRGRFGV
jgi:hypothetical protein